MSGVGTPTKQGLGKGRGRIDKREAILNAAFTVFAREGYAQAGVDAIAAEAAVAKATVYNHFQDKEDLLHQAIGASADEALARNLAAIERLTDADGDLRDVLESVGTHLVECYCDERSWALRRLLAAEVQQFPGLLDIVRGRAADRVTEALADRLARLTITGRLHTGDPVMAAEQFLSLLTGPMDQRCLLGTRRLSDTERQAVVGAAVDTFLQAFAARPSGV